MLIAHQDKLKTLVSQQTIKQIRETPDAELFTQEMNLKYAIDKMAERIEMLASELAGIGREHLELQTKRATKSIPEAEADLAIAANRRQYSEAQLRLISEQEAARGLEASLLAMSAEVKQRKLAITAAEKKKLCDYATVLFEAYEKQVAEQMRQLVILASWKSGLPLLGEMAVAPDTVLRYAMNHSMPTDHTLWTLQSIIDAERQLRIKVLGG